MTRATPSGWMRAVAAALVLFAVVAGAGRAHAVGPTDGRPDIDASGLETSDLETSELGSLGLRAPICHSGSSAPAAPDAPARPDCCDACALLAPATLPAAPAVPTRTAMARPAERAAVPTPLEGLPRQRGPRQSQGPPRG